jgi:hypothetical protein
MTDPHDALDKAIAAAMREPAPPALGVRVRDRAAAERLARDERRAALLDAALLSAVLGVMVATLLALDALELLWQGVLAVTVTSSLLVWRSAIRAR